MNNVFFVSWVVITLYILLETDAVPKWSKLLRLRFMAVDEWEEKRKLFDVPYRTFIQTKFPNFILFLLTCQECLGTWFCIMGYLIWHKQLGGWVTFGLTTIGVFIGIAAFKYLLKKLYE